MIKLTNKSESVNPENYFSLREVLNHVGQVSSIKYKTVFSFEPILKKSNLAKISFSSELRSLLKSFSDSVNDNKWDYNNQDQQIDFDLINHLFEIIFLGYQGMAIIGSPFSKNVVIPNPVFNERIVGNEWEVNFDISQKEEPPENFSSFNQLVYILNNFYGQNIKETISRKLIFRHKKTGLKKYYKIESNRNFIEVKINGDLPQLSEAEINALINDYSDALFEEKIGREKITFYGFEISNFINITKIEAINDFRYQLLNDKSEFGTSHLISSIKSTISSILDFSNVDVGLTFLEPIFDAHLHSHSLTGLLGKELLQQYVSKGQVGKVYKDVFEKKITVCIESLSVYENKNYPEQILQKNGYRSAILIPLIIEEDDISIIIEIATKDEKVKFGNYTIIQLKDFIEALKGVFFREKISFQQSITEVVQRKFTSIHPSVYWKFEQAAVTYLTEKVEGKKSIIPPIAFSQLNTMFGQADIVSSSTLRNACIQKDLIKNLVTLKSLITKKKSEKSLHLLGYYENRIDQYLNTIREHFISALESEIVSFITKEVHPYLKELSKREIGINKNKYENYLAMLDKEYSIVYKERKKFEDSVTQLNSLLGNFIDEEDAKMQKVLPHYYEKYTTDGVEYNIYLGQDLIEKNKEFTMNDIANFRIWQLEMMCKLVRIVEKNKSQLPIPLTTAQLIFVYNQPLSILFRMEEKKFDVDGAYNVRYEILKKRIDKATIKGTEERLTVEGKIGIVYLSDEDKRKYVPYINYLVKEGYIQPQVEDLELNNLKGADGLRALRITVKL